MAKAMLGKWEEAAKDLHVASNIDYDEEIHAVLKKVEPNAHKIEEHRRKYDRLHKEKEERKVECERQRRKAEAQAAYEKAKKREQSSLSGFPGGMPGGFPGGMPGGFPGGMPGGFPGGMRGGKHGQCLLDFVREFAELVVGNQLNFSGKKLLHYKCCFTIFHTTSYDPVTKNGFEYIKVVRNTFKERICSTSYITRGLEECVTL